MKFDKKIIEEILKDLGKDVRLARDGTNKWDVREGSARIRINYNTSLIQYNHF